MLISHDGWTVCAPIGALALNCLVHIALSRHKCGHAPMVCLFAGFLAGLGLLVSWLIVLAFGHLSIDFLGYVLVDVMSYLALSYGYFHFVNLNLASLRIRLLREIARSDTGLSVADILEKYNASRVVQNRVERLVRGGHLKKQNGRYVVGRRFYVWLFGLFELMKLAVLGRGNKLVK